MAFSESPERDFLRSYLHQISSIKPERSPHLALVFFCIALIADALQALSVWISIKLIQASPVYVAKDIPTFMLVHPY